MTSSNVNFWCVGSGTFHQGNEELFPVTHNKQCTGNSACALAWMTVGRQFTSEIIDEILRTGDRLYKLRRNGKELGTGIFLSAEEVPREFTMLGYSFRNIDVELVFYGLYPNILNEIETKVNELTRELSVLMTEEQPFVGFLFTGRLVTVAFWYQRDPLTPNAAPAIFLFDPHAVNEKRMYDFENPNVSNFARLFKCNSLLTLARLLLSNAALDGKGEYQSLQYEINKFTFNNVDQIPSPLNMHERQSNTARYEVIHSDEEPSNFTQDKPKRGRPPKKKVGRPNLLETTREAAVLDNSNHPEDRNERLRLFKVKNPKLEQLRHVSKCLKRQIIENGPMAYWSGKLLSNINPYKLKNLSLWNENTYKCLHCGARLYEEEKGRKKWCCGEGAYNVLNLSPLEASFYRNREFLNRSRAYNDLFAFCARQIPGGYRHPSGLSFFKIEGRMYHVVYNLRSSGEKYTTRGGIAQLVNQSRLYIDDGEERRNIAEGRSLNPGIINDINTFIHANNPYVASFRMLGQESSVNAHLDFEKTTRATHGPRAGDKNTGIEVHAVLCTEETNSERSWLCVWNVGKYQSSRIDVLNPLMEPFQYPLLYPGGTTGWYIGRLDNYGKKLTQFNYSRCLLLSQLRFSQLGRLSQAWQVEMFSRFEEERLRYITNVQTALRAAAKNELIQGQVIQDITRDETVQGEGGPQPGKVYLPSSFTGGPRYMKVHYENAMGLVARKGAPTFFLTFTYSASWEEHKQACRGGPIDPPTACRIFQLKLQELMRDLRSGAFFGSVAYIVYVIEMQMRGLPHSHIVFKLEGDGPVQANDIDSVIWAGIPSENEANGRLRALVLKHMIHGPCGTDHRTDFLCWDSQKGYCTKFYPKPNVTTTHVDERGFVQYRRDYTNKGHIKSRNKSIEVHDGWVVPYNPALLLKYEAHINLELSSTRRVIKYLFKYLMKGGSLQNVTITPLRDQIDEVEHYVTKRMIGASDACWRLLAFDMSKSEPTIECLPVHLEGKEIVYFKANKLDHALEHSTSKLLIYFGRPNLPIFDDLTYPSFYENYMVHTKRPEKSKNVYDHTDGIHFITARQRGEKVCRLVWVSPQFGEVYFLRILLLTIPCRGFKDLLSRGGSECTTFQQVARHLGLVDDEREYIDALKEASKFMVGWRLRSFFVILCNLGAPAAILWDQFKKALCEDHLERNPHDPELAIKRSLIEIDRSLRKRGSCLTDHGLPYVKDNTTELGRELITYGVDQQTVFVEEWLPRLSKDQLRVFNHVKSLLDNPADTLTKSRVLFVDGPGGYGKTQLLRVILAYVRSKEKVAIAVASSGIAAQSMPGGTTAHSMFVIPTDIGNGKGVWNVSNSSQRGQLITAAQLIIFDEAPMAHRYIFEILDRSLQDLMNNRRPFGDKIFICSGDFRQIAPVVVKARNPSDIVDVSLRNSQLWSLFKVFHLTTPQRSKENVAYCDFLLQVGNGTLPPTVFGEGHESKLLIPLRGVTYVTLLEDLIAKVFPPNILNDPDASAKRAILAPFIVNVKQVNGQIINSLQGQLHELLSTDSVNRENDDGLNVDIQLLHQSTAKGVPDHVLRLKIGSVCLIMRNLNISDGLANGTKVIVTAISPRLITVRMPGGTQLFGIPRITFNFSLVEGSPLRILRRQFPLMLAYAMSGHKSQGQTIEFVGIDLRTDCFTHGQLYVLLSRVRSPNDVLVLVPNDQIRNGVAYVKNIVYKELLDLHFDFPTSSSKP